MSEMWRSMNTSQPSEPDVECGKVDIPASATPVECEKDEVTFTVHMRGGYEGAYQPAPGSHENRKAQRAKLLSAPFDQRMQEFLGCNVVYSEGGAGTVNLASLHRYMLHTMQKELVLDAFDFTFGEPETVRRDLAFRLHGYKVALEDWDYIKQCALKGKMNDPFIVTTEKELDDVLLKEMAEKWGNTRHFDTNSTLEERKVKLRSAIHGAVGSMHHEPRDKNLWKELKTPRHINNREDAFELFMLRLRMAAIGGAFMIGPMLIMVLHRSLLTSLLTASLCVVAFGLILTIYLEKPFEVLSGTAAYAAVMVVFVGTSGGPGGGS